MDEYFCLDIPIFQVKYKKWKKYGYKNEKERENLKDVLNESSNGYCMYCYSRIKIDNKWYGNLEHAIEKGNSDKLIECIPNIGMACPVCNQSFKRIGEKKRMLSEASRSYFEKKSGCSVERRKQCTVPCKALRNLQILYSKMEDAEIILQPMGVNGKISKRPLTLQYDIMNMQFLPDRNLHKYPEEKLFIEEHIKRFRLNDPKYRTKALFDFVKNVIDANGELPDYEYSNFVVQLFADKIKEKTKKERVSICSAIYPSMFLKV